MRMKSVLYSVLASFVLANALYVPARAAGLNIETATIADLNAALASGTLTSETLVSAYLKRIEAYDKKGPAINAIITLNKKALDEARQLDVERKNGNVRGPLVIKAGGQLDLQSIHFFTDVVRTDPHGPPETGYRRNLAIGSTSLSATKFVANAPLPSGSLAARR